ncbi:hypothetical protein [Methylobacterium sp. J-077]|uniref:hypothetical protein n=1 Tax=Methylobacterium sp. J-077 TaxID=2836656 RepID=UPI001FB95D21|nr:hypothetical protein [Methylobacterium sp. J-077]MCJ2124184.1 hypothetical protein [Methylobacterium sp. J-077]
MRKGRSKSGASQRPLPESLTQHLSDPKIRVLKTPDGRKRPSRAAGAVRKVCISIVTLAVIVLAGGHLVHAW